MDVIVAGEIALRFAVGPVFEFQGETGGLGCVEGEGLGDGFVGESAIGFDAVFAGSPSA